MGIVAVGVLVAAVVYAFKPKKPAPSVVQQAPAIPAYQPVATPNLLDLHYAYGEQREREMKYERYKQALDGIAILTSKPTPPPNA
jgi:hypothetical protein